MENIDILKKLLYEAQHGDENGIRPDLTQDEIDSIKWAIGKIETIIK